MSKLLQYEDKLVRVTDRRGNAFTGAAKCFSAAYGLRAFGREEEGIRIGSRQLFEGEIEEIACLPTYEAAVAAIPPGRYRHFKGGEYEVLCIARHSETEEPLVVYRALYGERGVWVRPADMWLEKMERDGRICGRFERIEE